MPADDQLLADLRCRLAKAALRSGPAEVGHVTFGAPILDDPLGGGIVRAALHEIYASGTADLAAATGLSVGLAIRAAGTRPILWVRQDVLDAETGRLHPAGFVELGFDPSRILLVRARDAQGVLRAGVEAARCAALGAVLIEPWGEPRLLDLTASRRLALAAEGSGVMTVLLRASRMQDASAARTRWQVASLPSRALEANAPGDPAFSLRLLRHRGGLGEREWRVEWNRERQSFQEQSAFQQSAFSDRAASPNPADAAPLSRSVVPFPADRPAAEGAQGSGLRKAG
jgi:protein ImuA